MRVSVKSAIGRGWRERVRKERYGLIRNIKLKKIGINNGDTGGTTASQFFKGIRATNEYSKIRKLV